MERQSALRFSRKKFSFYDKKKVNIKYRMSARARSKTPTRSELDEAEPGQNEDGEGQELLNRPIGSEWRQQKLPAWQPLLTANTVLPAFLLIGLLFIPTGVFLLVTSNDVQQKIYDYTDCDKDQCLPKSRGDSCLCAIAFDLEEDYERDVFLYYSLANYYQNHRRYVKSRDDGQLEEGLIKLPSNDCELLDYVDGRPVAPCGVIANSLFNDTFSLSYRKVDVVDYMGNQITVPLNQRDIAWPTDKSSKYKNPANMSYAFLNYYIKPPSWNVSAYLLDPNDQANNGYLNERFLVWMRVSAFSSFRKLYARVVHKPFGLFKDGLPKGSYIMMINYNYPVRSFDGRKMFIISNTSWLGGKNPFLGIAYMVAGFCLLLLTAFLYFVRVKYGKSEQEYIDINSKTPYFS